MHEKNRIVCLSTARQKFLTELPAWDARGDCGGAGMGPPGGSAERSERRRAQRRAEGVTCSPPGSTARRMAISVTDLRRAVLSTARQKFLTELPAWDARG